MAPSWHRAGNLASAPPDRLSQASPAGTGPGSLPEPLVPVSDWTVGVPAGPLRATGNQIVRWLVPLPRKKLARCSGGQGTWRAARTESHGRLAWCRLGLDLEPWAGAEGREHT